MPDQIGPKSFGGDDLTLCIEGGQGDVGVRPDLKAKKVCLIFDGLDGCGSIWGCKVIEADKLWFGALFPQGIPFWVFLPNFFEPISDCTTGIG